ncbi:MAG: patatin-like phospholipase family protein [Clostridia bacterium]|nr:patatin-like phospholipase family protein [Clostridia bacterium]
MDIKKFFKKMFKKEEKQPEKPLKTGIVFSGGGVRGLAYIGVIRAFQEAGISFDYVAGTSIGSFIAALYAADIPVEKMEEKAISVKQKDFHNAKFFILPSKTNKFENLIGEMLEGFSFENLKRPLCVCAVDIKTGKEQHIKSGNLVKAIAGSCAVPGYFEPVDFGEMRLVDGGLLNNIPADALREMGADIVVSLDINPNRGYGTESEKTLDILKASLRILMTSNAINGYVHSDYVLKIDLNDFSQLKITDTKELIKRGYEGAKKGISGIIETLNLKEADKSIKKMTRRLKLIKKQSEKLEKLTKSLNQRERWELTRIGREEE